VQQPGGPTRPAAAAGQTEPDRPLAYSAAAPTANRPAPGPTGDSPTTSAPSAQTPTTAPPATAKDDHTVATASRARPTAGRRAELNWNAVIAFVLSAIGLLSPVGIWLGYRTRAAIDANRQIGREFATAAIIIGWLWVTFLVLGVLAYLWILI
ncbi:DUF4190 domain-containing protein, partial [Gordonia sp. (in: high G+C Gram-positive bacteria)]